MSSRTRSTGRLARVARASRPFSAKVTVCPSCSRARPSSRRLTRLSSTTRRSPVGPLRGEVTSQVSQRVRGALVVLGQPVEPAGRPVEAPGPRRGLELARQRGQAGGTEALGRRLQRVGGPAERVAVVRGEGAAQGREQLAGVLSE